MEVKRTELGQLRQLGSAGGQGAVYEASALRDGQFGVSMAMVVKLYHPYTLPSAAGQDELRRRIAWARQLAPTAFTELLELVSWPVASVVDGHQVVGLVLPDMRPRFEVEYAPLTLPGKPRLRESGLLTLEWLLEPEGYLHDRGLEIAFDTRLRAKWCLELARTVCVLHEYDIVVGDFSMSNVLGRPENQVLGVGRSTSAVAFIDADSMLFEGRQVTKLVGTPGWELPDSWNERPETKQADLYKLGLSILRLFARSQNAATPLDPRRFPGTDNAIDWVPEEIRAPVGITTATCGPHSSGDWTIRDDDRV